MTGPKKKKKLKKKLSASDLAGGVGGRTISDKDKKLFSRIYALNRDVISPKYVAKEIKGIPAMGKKILEKIGMTASGYEELIKKFKKFKRKKPLSPHQRKKGGKLKKGGKV